MIIAILEDNKGFRRSYNLAKFRNKIQIPDRGKLSDVYFKPPIELTRPSIIKSVYFKFYKWLEENKIALYREA